MSGLFDKNFLDEVATFDNIESFWHLSLSVKSFHELACAIVDADFLMAVGIYGTIVAIYAWGRLKMC